MHDGPGMNCGCGADQEELTDRPDRCSDCGAPLVWRDADGGAAVRECPDCE